jgi:hypothetical protein
MEMDSEKKEHFDEGVYSNEEEEEGEDYFVDDEEFFEKM